ncbi:hypothetical protein [Acinetobacter sp. Marseille-Q1618]|uniref:beta family protein n=1 Tax=Acinetobacter sp. Marseille-Q1618 TaxID=2697502 RepID=UPI001570FE96|nr:hypothetical protein [Acinetobacter sp. Marseille-Q1618]
MLQEKIYVPFLRSGASELNALTALPPEHKSLIAPLLFLTGNDWNKITSFIDSYESHLWIDSSKFKLDEETPISIQLNDSTDNYDFKFNKYIELQKINENIAPIITLYNEDNTRNTIKLIKKFTHNFRTVGIRINPTLENYKDIINLLDKILLSFDDITIHNLAIFLDLGKIDSSEQTEKEHVINFTKYIQENLSPKTIVTSSTSYPPKPVGIIYQECFDPIWQETIKHKLSDFKFIYGDYAATSPTDIIKPTTNMRPRPAATYLLNNLTWYIESQGKAQEFIKFIQIAKNIRNLDGYHGDDFSWANEEIKRISQITDPTQKGYGGQQTWNEIKIHQHICAMLESKINQLDNPEEFEYW